MSSRQSRGEEEDRDLLTVVVDDPTTPPPANPDTTTTRMEKEESDPERKTPTPPSGGMVDRFLKSYVRFMGSPTHQDRSLKLLQYSLWMFSEYSAVSRRRPKVRKSLKKLYLEISFARYVLRFLQLPEAIEAAKNNSWSAAASSSSLSNSKKDRVHNFVGRILAWSMLAYYPLEYLAYLEWQTPRLVFSTGPSRIAEKLSAWSCRGWFAYIAAEIVQSFLRLREEQEEGRKRRITAEGLSSSITEQEQQQAEEDSSSSLVTTNLRLQLARDFLFTLPCIHWSLPNWDTDPWLSEQVVNTLMWLESAVCMYQSIHTFREG